MLYGYGQSRTRTTPPLTHLRFDGILLCEANRRCRDDKRISTKRRSKYRLEQRARRRGKPVEVWVTDEEKAEIDARANSAGLSRSAYMRAAGLNHRVGAIADLDAVRDLVKVNGDFGRLAGLLKLWLAEKRGQGARPFDVEALMMQFRELQHQTRAIMSRIVFKKK
ncbi:plasmid mobilization protein [Bordetella genomosp. 2]|uniref:plasmid mobilization protein n=1 Tax=Bordetella genomosp. 2 TaxID=1983456 RepID=UPI003D80AC96